jgi:hypothetical protein
VPDKLAVIAAEDYSGAIHLVLEDVLVAAHLLASSLPVATLKFNLSQKVTRDAVHFIELGVATAKGTVVRVFGKPVALAICANGFFANFTL